jgi:hypothetical protein
LHGKTGKSALRTAHNTKQGGLLVIVVAFSSSDYYYKRSHTVYFSGIGQTIAMVNRFAAPLETHGRRLLRPK